MAKGVRMRGSCRTLGVSRVSSSSVTVGSIITPPLGLQCGAEVALPATGYALEGGGPEQVEHATQLPVGVAHAGLELDAGHGLGVRAFEGQVHPVREQPDAVPGHGVD